LILLLAVFAGLAAGLLRAWLGGRELVIPDLRMVWLVPVAYLPQFLAFQLPAAQRLIADEQVAVALVGSQVLLLVFAWFNRKQPGVWLLGLGLLLNMTVITLNGGLMPIRPDIIPRLAPDAPVDAWGVGERLGNTKDIVLPAEETHFGWLSDRFLLPAWFPYQVAFSIGDVFISAGAFWLLWKLAGKSKQHSKGVIGV
jgi:hypothetical protein